MIIGEGCSGGVGRVPDVCAAAASPRPAGAAPPPHNADIVHSTPLHTDTRPPGRPSSRLCRLRAHEARATRARLPAPTTHMLYELGHQSAAPIDPRPTISKSKRCRPTLD